MGLVSSESVEITEYNGEFCQEKRVRPCATTDQQSTAGYNGWEANGSSYAKDRLVKTIVGTIWNLVEMRYRV